jgi:hypothetical protein
MITTPQTCRIPSHGRSAPHVSLLVLLALLLPALAAAPALAAERRCGWLDNPTPGNFWLRDADGEWTLSEQGGYEAEDFDRMPSDDSGERVVTNGSSYGYSCICLQVETEVRGRQRLIRRVISGTMEPLSRCRRDPRLPARRKGDSRP